MVEIFRDTDPVTLTLELAGASDVTATVTRDGEVVSTATGDTFTLPFAITGYDGPFQVEWDFTVGDQTGQKRFESHEVVTPYWTVSDIRSEITFPSDVTDGQIIKTERYVRRIIERYCGQKFGRRHATLPVVGTASGELRLPERLIGFESIDGFDTLTPEYYAVRGNGWYLGANVDFPDGDFVFTAVIRDPFELWDRGFKENSVYKVTGYWGYDDVPINVKDAAAILIEQYLCPDSEYRDRYITSGQYADAQFEYDGKAFDGTGNVIADQLLGEFVRSRLFAVI